MVLVNDFRNDVLVAITRKFHVIRQAQCYSVAKAGNSETTIKIPYKPQGVVTYMLPVEVLVTRIKIFDW